MKRFISMTLCLIICATMFVMLVGCECRHEYANGKCIHCQSIDPQVEIERKERENELSAAKNAYNSLIEAHNLTVEIMESIYNAWYFAIYKADDYDFTDDFVMAFDFATGLSNRAAMDAILSELGYSQNDVWRYLLISDFSYAVAVVQRTQKITYETIDTKLASAQAEIKKLSNKYSDYTGLGSLKSYYSEISAYLAFCKSPNCSFSQLSTTMSNYENNLTRYKQELAIYLS